jgi:mannose-6-phosphate isomerase-like protein (cupin superfamily)
MSYRNRTENLFHRNKREDKMHLEKIKISEKLASFSDHWSPKIIAQPNGQHVKVAKLLGEFDWHFHEREDELFWVIRGNLQMHFRDPADGGQQMIELGPGEMVVVPKGVLHRPVAENEVEIVLFEPASTLNTGNLDNDRTRRDLEKI